MDGDQEDDWKPPQDQDDQDDRGELEEKDEKFQRKDFDIFVELDRISRAVEDHRIDLRQPRNFNGTLKEFQLDGFRWLCALEAAGINGILDSWSFLADEMGCGKTIQIIAFILQIYHTLKGPILIVAPLSIIDNWKLELERFAPSLRVLIYAGSKEDRLEISETFSNLLKSGTFPHILLTTYELCNRDYDFISSIQWPMLIVDEAQRLKNSSSLLYRNLFQLDIKRIFLLTVQNNFDELFALLKFTNSSVFPSNSKTLISYLESDSSLSLIDAVQKVIKPFMLRRLKEEVVKDLANIREIILYSGMSSIQKKVYLSILKRDLAGFSDKHSVSFANVLMQLRKCVNHPYLFPGIEPEPFEIGQHLIDASGKLVILDKLLKYLKSRENRVLIFSQMTSVLDILQDYLDYKEYTYERLDGSVRGSDRSQSVSRFSQNDTFVFLLSTRAGGVGLNLTAADVVIFFDSDYNPQNDLQAASRAHRIGQTKNVLVIRLITSGTVEEIILKRAQTKAKLTQSVLAGVESQHKSLDESSEDILKYGLENLLESSDDSTQFELNFDEILSGKEEAAEVHQEVLGIYSFEGKDYKATVNDELAYQNLKQSLDDQDVTRKRVAGPGHRLEDEYELLEAERKRRKIELDKRKAEKKRELWDKNNYNSLNVPFDPNVVANIVKDSTDLLHVSGTLTRPQLDDEMSGKPVIIAFCVDNSGAWTDRGIFGHISRLSQIVEKKYYNAYENQDLHVGDSHLISIPAEDSQKAFDDDGTNRPLHVSLLVCQKRSKNGRVSDVLPGSLEESLNRLSQFALETNASVHVPHLGDRSTGSNYQAERLVKKCLCERGVPTLMYYYRKR